MACAVLGAGTQTCITYGYYLQASGTVAVGKDNGTFGYFIYKTKTRGFVLMVLLATQLVANSYWKGADRLTPPQTSQKQKYTQR